MNGLPTVSPVLIPKDQLLREHFQKEQQQLDLSERKNKMKAHMKTTVPVVEWVLHKYLWTR